MNTKGLSIIIILIVCVVVLFSSAFIVDETEQVVITQFGKVIRTRTTPGLGFRWPGIQKANYFPKNLLAWDGDPGEVPTLEKKYIWVDAFARWKIIDPVIFFETTKNIGRAETRLNEILDPAVRNLLQEHQLIEAVRNSNREMDTFEPGLEDMQGEKITTYGISVGREKITQQIREQAQPKLAEFGVELVDVKIKRLNYSEQVRDSVYNRMIAERKQIAEKFRSEGQGESRKILGDKERKLKEITSEAYKKAQEIKGKADAEATKIFADAFGKDPEFYSFLRTLEIYNGSLDQSSSLVLSTDSDIFKYLKDYSK